MRVIYDIDLFYKDAEAAANPAYIAMFVKHLHYRCRVLTLGCDAAIDSLEHTCWTEDAFDKERIYFGQVDVSCQFQTGTTASTKALGQYNGKDVIQSIERQSLFEVAKKNQEAGNPSRWPCCRSGSIWASPVVFTEQSRIHDAPHSKLCTIASHTATSTRGGEKPHSEPCDRDEIFNHQEMHAVAFTRGKE